MTERSSTALARRVMQDTVVKQLHQVEQTLARIARVDQAKQLIDVAHAQHVFARRQRLGEEVIGHAHLVKTRAQIRLGELLRELEKQAGVRGRPGPGRGQKRPAAQGGRLAPPTLKELGITWRESAQAQQLAALPAATREQIARRELTLADAMRAGKRARRYASLKDAAWPDGQYGVILADPPQQPEEGTLPPSRQIENQYPTMSLDALIALAPKVEACAMPDCVLALWTPAQKVAEAVDLTRAWGFEVKSGGVWVKPSIGMGYWFRQRHELLILATRGTPRAPLEDDRPDSVIIAPRGEHSEKPDEVYTLLEQMFPLVPKLELFARTARAGWDRMGNECHLRGEELGALETGALETGGAA